MPTVVVDSREVERALAVIARMPLEGLEDLHDEVEKLGLHVQRRAMKRTPVKDGPLRDSAKAELTTRRNQLVSVISYGGLASPYAEVQHERKDFNHPKGGRDHYLYGEPYSAWNDPEQRMVKQQLTKAVLETAKAHMASIGGGK